MLYEEKRVGHKPGMLGVPSHGWGTFQGISEEFFVVEQPCRPINRPQIRIYRNLEITEARLVGNHSEGLSAALRTALQAGGCA